MWITKYKPKTFKKFIDNKKCIRLLQEWYKNYLNGDDLRNIILIYGPIGSGKSLLFEIFSNNYKFKVININTNNKYSNIKKVFIKNLEFKNILSFMNDKLTCILLDNLVFNKDKNNIKELIKISLKQKKLVFFITDKIDTTLQNNKNILILELLKPKYDEVLYFIRQIQKKENIEIDYKIIKDIYFKSNADIRYILNNLYELKYSKKTLDITLKGKDISFSYEELLDLFTKKKLTLEEICNNLYGSSFIPFTLYDNFHTINDFKIYTICMKNFNYANIINNNLFNYSNYSNDYFNILSTGYFNYFITLKSKFTASFKHSIILNKLNNLKKNKSYDIYPIYLLIELYKIFLKIDKKHKNDNYITLFNNYCVKYNIDYKKIIKDI